MVDIREQSPLTLAFVGDAVYSLMIREYLATDKRYNINKLHHLTVCYVSAHGQMQALGIIENMLTEEEKNIIKRGHNSSKASVAKHATVEEYRSSTGFECLMGYLELTGQKDRLKEIVEYIIANFKIEE
ncbi:MAG: ribonuclease III domain-containing protein [Oscillospiraceae bacterium]|nr:ribonuclease III domain-containing protein [Oscillospiraceae bacterium]